MWGEQAARDLQALRGGSRAADRESVFEAHGSAQELWRPHCARSIADALVLVPAARGPSLSAERPR